MQPEQLLRFGRYWLDPQTGQLWRGKREVKVTPKAAAVLGVLVTQVGQVVTKDQLFQTVWPDTVVSDAALTACIQELRHALRDDARHPRYLETVHKRGFRFIGKVASSQYPVVSIQNEENQKSKVKGQKSKVELHSPTPSPQHPAPTLVGRESELTQLHQWLAKALHGERQIVFVSGEPGIGKTALVETFLFGVRSPKSEVKKSPKSKVQGPKSPNPDPRSPTPDPWGGRGQCIEHYGAGEAYLPVLEALGRLCREPDGAQLITVLKQYAPTWLVQMPALLDAAEMEALQRKTAGATRERMLRELAEAIEVMTAGRPLVLWLEDLHWSDVSTLDWLAFVARRREIARLLVIGTYRPVEVLTREHPLKGIKQELQTHGQCEELALDFLSEGAVAEYLTQRFSAPSPAAAGEGRGEGLSQTTLRKLAHVIHQRTDGNPLFMVNVVEHLLSQGVLIQVDGQWVLKNEELATAVPRSLRQMIEQQIERVGPEERKVLEAASVAGAEFSAAAVAAALTHDVVAVEEQCTALAERQQFLRRAGIAEWPDGTVAARYGFVHALYQQLWHERVSVTQLQRWHLRIGERKEAAYGKHVAEIATELAVHFEQGRDYPRAVQYLGQAGRNASRWSAHREAITLLTKGLDLLNPLPDTPESTQQELLLLKTIGPALISVKGYGAPEVEQTYARAYDLCQQGGRPRQLIGVLQGLQAFYLVRGEVRKVQDLAKQTFRLAQSISTPTALMAAHGALGISLYYVGELTAAREHFEQAWVLYNPQEHNSRVTRSWGDPGVLYLSYAAMTLWHLGYPDQALEKVDAALLLAQEVAHPFSLAFALAWAAALYFSRSEVQTSQAHTEALIALATDQEFPDWVRLGTAQRGAGLVEQGEVEAGIAQLHEGLVGMQALGQEMGRPYYIACLAKAYGKQGQTEEGLRVMAEALAAMDRIGERFYEAELYRLKGELTLAQSSVQSLESGVQENQKAKGKSQKAKVPNPKSQAEACFQKAIEIARRQQAKSLELCATISLARLWQSQGKHHEAHNMLVEVYGWFTEGFETKDLREAKMLLESLG